ncbi:lytic transglycosylase domain-containing protein [Streptomyces sp. NBC_00289]|uniref:lytic transglycosylase domain-containing protein n=1 Tax=Streptomyces sp. NBC_00289 TaxID=2975703 RepID=UPI003253ECE4
MKWELVAAIGRIESVHASGYGLREDGYTDKAIRGPQLNGQQFALIRDTDAGVWDGDRQYDRAVGPTQFIPSTWKQWGTDGNGDGKRDPNNIYDAALATGLYLCAGDRNLSTSEDLKTAVLSYNRSTQYYDNVLSWMRTYEGGGVAELPNTGTGTRLPHLPTLPTPPVSPSAPSTPAMPSAPGAPPTPTTPRTPPAPPKRDAPVEPEPPTRPTTPPHTTDPKPPKPVPIGKLTRVGASSFTADAGTVFLGRAKVMAVRTNGKAAAGQKIRFAVIGDTDARFTGGLRTVTVTTSAQGVAIAPCIEAGDRPSTFTIRAHLVSTHIEGVTPVAFAGTVLPAADKLTRTSDTALEASSSSTFGKEIGFKATLNGKAAAGVALVARVVADGGTEPVSAGPYFKDAKDRPLRTLTLTTTGTDGLVLLPELFTDENAGAYQLVLTATNGVTVTVDLTVTETTATPSPQPSTAP